MKNKRGLIFVVLVVIIISGCTNLPNIQNVNLPSFGQKEKSISESKGLQINFLENQPPLNEIFGNQNFKVSLKLINNDPEPISGTITLSDTPSDEFSSLKGKEQQSFSLAAAEKSDQKTIPAEEIIRFGPFQYDESKIFPDMKTNFIVEVLTNHRTVISTQICIKSESSEAKCPNKETITNLGGQAKYSPITITKIEKTIVPEEEGLLALNLAITLKNIGKGKIESDDQTLNSFQINFQGSKNLVCSKTNKISLKDNERTISCTAELSIEDEVFRQDVLDISYEYPYKIIETLGPIKITKIET